MEGAERMEAVTVRGQIQRSFLDADEIAESDRIVAEQSFGRTAHDGAYLCDCSRCRAAFPARRDAAAVRAQNRSEGQP